MGVTTAGRIRHLDDTGWVISAIARVREGMGYFPRDAAVPTARRREGAGSRATPLLAEDRSPSMNLLLAAIGATVIALVEATLAPYIKVGDAGPHPVLVGGVIWTIAAGIDRGVTWAFVGGLVLDSLLGRALGTSAFALLLAVGVSALLAKPVPRLRLVLPVIAVPVISVGYSMVIFALETATQPGLTVADPARLFLPGAIYDGILGMFIGPLVVAIHARRAATERMDW